jgi:hypothetical protein
MSHSRRRLRWLLLLPALALVGSAGARAAVEVSLELPVRAKVDLQGRKTLGFAPFLVLSKEGDDNSRLRTLDVQREFERYVTKLVQRNSDLKVVKVTAADFPTYDLALLEKNSDYWRAYGERARVDLILFGSLDFDIKDQTGYRTEEYVSPLDGRTYYRQVLVEQTGFEYDIVMQVYDARDGQLLYSDNFKDFKKFEGERADPLLGMFENLYSLEDRIAGIFAQRKVETTRVLFNN